MNAKNKELKRTIAGVRIRYAFLKTLTSSDLSRRRLPFMSAESVQAGPVVCLWARG